MARFKQYKLEPTTGKKMRYMVAESIQKGTPINKKGWNDADKAWFTYWTVRTNAWKACEAALEDADEAYLATKSTQITPKQQKANNDKAASALFDNLDADQKAAFMAMLTK